MINLSVIDKFITQSDRALRTIAAGEQASDRPSPARQQRHCELNDSERAHVAGLMRVNHAGEVCAQALYQGQALTAKLPEVRQEMEHAAAEEVDHLVWCEERLYELDAKPSVLNPLWYGMSFAIGATAGLVSDKVSLGFVAATEDLVCGHLSSHLEKLPEDDQRTRAVLEQMHEDELRHGEAALAAGGYEFPAPIKRGMSEVAKVMTTLAYRF
ncbi:MAG: 2-polyprenyl-3-methyl-6-methoxy-1,4-benzoquinone monooxygenase [Pseudomonadales bacterium]|jgi:ubiquinone biosynthesis monooxygenase Coq7